MSDWNTLHYFDDKKFYSKIVSDFKNNGNLINHYFNSEYGKQIVYGYYQSDERINEIIRFSQFLDEDFKSHEILINIQTRKKGITEEHIDFIKKLNDDQDDFFKENGQIIEDINQILTLMVFSECASFNPHLILGRRIFTECVIAKPNSIADEIITKFTNNEVGSIFGSYSNGFINWITNEDLQLLWLDKENLKPSNKESEKYFSDFYIFLEIALENNLGLISGTNMNESILKQMHSPLSVEIDLKELGLESVINSPTTSSLPFRSNEDVE